MKHTSPQTIAPDRIQTLPARHASALAQFDSLPDSAHARLPVVAALLGIGPATVWGWTKNGTLPAPLRRGRSTRWPVGELRRSMVGSLMAVVMEADVRAAALSNGFAPVADRPLFCLRTGKDPHIASGERLSGSFAEPALPSRLMTLDQALSRHGRSGTDEVGIVLYPGCGVVGLDLDDCVVGREYRLRPESVRVFLDRQQPRDLARSTPHE